MADKRNRQTALPEHPSDELVSRTLASMNRRLEENRARPVSQPRRTHRVQAFSLAAAAAVLAVFLLVQGNAKLEPVSFSYQPDLRLNAVTRTEYDGQSDLAQLAAELDAALTPGKDAPKRTDYLFYDFAMNEQSAPMWFATAQYEGAHDLRLTVSSFATTLHSALENGAPADVNGTAVRTGVDAATGDFFAVWRTGGRYVQLQVPGGGKLKDGEKRGCIAEMLQLPLMKD